MYTVIINGRNNSYWSGGGVVVTYTEEIVSTHKVLQAALQQFRSLRSKLRPHEAMYICENNERSIYFGTRHVERDLR